MLKGFHRERSSSVLRPGPHREEWRASSQHSDTAVWKDLENVQTKLAITGGEEMGLVMLFPPLSPSSVCICFWVSDQPLF